MSEQKNRQKWEEEILGSALEKFPERKPHFRTSSGIELPALFTPEDVESDYLENIGFPGEHPYTRGVQATMYRGRLWTMRQYAGYATAAESNGCDFVSR